MQPVPRVDCILSSSSQPRPLSSDNTPPLGLVFFVVSRNTPSVRVQETTGHDIHGGRDRDRKGLWGGTGIVYESSNEGLFYVRPRHTFSHTPITLWRSSWTAPVRRNPSHSYLSSKIMSGISVNSTPLRQLSNMYSQPSQERDNGVRGVTSWLSIDVDCMYPDENN